MIAFLMRLFTPLAKRTAAGLIRHAASALGAVLVANGYATQGQADQISSYVVGLGLIIFAIVWSRLDKSSSQNLAKRALATVPPAGLTTHQLNERELKSLNQ